MREYSQWESHMPIHMHGLNHGISAPAWEVSEFITPDANWVSSPNWMLFPKAAEVNSKYSDMKRVQPSITQTGLDSTIDLKAEGRINLEAVKSYVGRQIAKSPFHKPFNSYLVKRSIRRSPNYQLGSDEISILYGADSLLKMRLPQPHNQVVSLEHGTVRWIADGAKDDAEWRKLYQKQVQKTQHLWVTNLDPRTLEIAEDIMPGKWAALPHPFMFNSAVPFMTDMKKRFEILKVTGSEYLILLASSQNWSKHHDKGSKKALEAFTELRKQGVPVGLVAAEWGLQLQESKDFLASSGLSSHVKWVSPMGRLELQKMMANVDVVWDQFGLDAFGALALRALEQGAPLVSRGLKPEGAALIGSQIPWMNAESVEQIVSQTNQLFLEMQSIGREQVLSDIAHVYRTWLNQYHSPRITASLQDKLYSSMVVDGQQISVGRDAWSKEVRNGRQK